MKLSEESRTPRPKFQDPFPLAILWIACVLCHLLQQLHILVSANVSTYLATLAPKKDLFAQVFKNVFLPT